MRISRSVLALSLTLFVITAALADRPALGDGQAGSGDEDRLGRVALPNSGSAEAQEPFLRALAALHSFWYDEAADLFRDAQRIDPDFALAYWGEALTYNHPLWSQYDGAAGREALDRLAGAREARAAKAGSPREREYLETAEVLFDSSHADKEARDRAYSAAWGRLHERYPEDLEAKSFYALSLQGLPRTGDARLHMQSAALMEEVFAANPLHPGAAHYLIHAYDDPVHAPLGLRAARLYAGIAPAANHALHMPSHIFVQLGMWERVAASNIDAYEASVAWVEQRDHPLHKRDFHSLAWLQYAYLQMGRYDQAAETLEILRPVATTTSDSRTRWSYRAMLAAQAVETGQPYGEMAGLIEVDTASAGDGKPDAGEPDAGQHCAALSYGDNDGLVAFGTGYAATRAGDLATARQAAATLAKTEDSDEEAVLEARRLILDALIASAEGKTEEALAKAGEAVEAELSLRPPSGPPDTFKPAYELYGELLLAAGRAEEATEKFRRSLLRTPKRTASVLGAARAAEALGDADAAREHYAQLLDNLAHADAGHPAVAEAKGYLDTASDERPAP